MPNKVTLILIRNMETENSIQRLLSNFTLVQKISLIFLFFNLINVESFRRTLQIFNFSIHFLISNTQKSLAKTEFTIKIKNFEIFIEMSSEQVHLKILYRIRFPEHIISKGRFQIFRHWYFFTPPGKKLEKKFKF